MTLRRLSRSVGPLLLATCGVSALHASDSRQAVHYTMSLVIGTDMDGVIHATQQCSRERKHAPCEPEEFAYELQAKGPSRVASFHLDRTEVSQAMYEHCVASGRCSIAPLTHTPSSLRGAELPIVFVTHHEASSYCALRGARLPTEAEFEVAARGLHSRLYPWGSLYHHSRANSGRSGPDPTSDQDGFALLAPVGALSGGTTPSGVMQLAGNAAEWTSSTFSRHGAAPQTVEKVVKGGSFADAPVHLRGTARQPAAPGTRSEKIGFRCARSRGVDKPGSP